MNHARRRTAALPPHLLSHTTTFMHRPGLSLRTARVSNTTPNQIRVPTQFVTRGTPDYLQPDSTSRTALRQGYPRLKSLRYKMSVKNSSESPITCDVLRAEARAACAPIKDEEGTTNACVGAHSATAVAIEAATFIMLATECAESSCGGIDSAGMDSVGCNASSRCTRTR